jgi:hypothetical protein
VPASAIVMGVLAALAWVGVAVLLYTFFHRPHDPESLLFAVLVSNFAFAFTGTAALICWRARRGLVALAFVAVSALWAVALLAVGVFSISRALFLQG